MFVDLIMVNDDEIKMIWNNVKQWLIMTYYVDNVERDFLDDFWYILMKILMMKNIILVVMFEWLIFVDEQNLRHFDANQVEFYHDKMRMHVLED
jgi:hypothetical protein